MNNSFISALEFQLKEVEDAPNLMDSLQKLTKKLNNIVY